MQKKELKKWNQLGESTELLHFNTLANLDSTHLSPDSLKNILASLLLLGVSLEDKNIFIKNFNLEKLRYYEENLNNEFQNLEFNLNEEEIVYFDENNLEKVNEGSYNIWQEINTNPFCMIRQCDKNKNKYELCINQAMARAFACLEQNITQVKLISKLKFLRSNAITELSQYNLLSTEYYSCSQAYKDITTKEPHSKYQFKQSCQDHNSEQSGYNYYQTESFNKDEYDDNDNAEPYTAQGDLTIPEEYNFGQFTS